MIGLGLSIPMVAARGRPGIPFAIDATADQIRAAMLDPASFASGGWRIPGTAGARIQANARASVAMQVRRDDLLGAELVTNGGFDSGAGWSTPGSTFTGGVVVSSNTGQIVWQNIGMVPGRTYTISLSYTCSSGLGLRANNSSTNGAAPVVTWFGIAGGSGTLTGRFVASGPIIAIEAEGALFTGTIDNVSVREVIVPAGGYEFAPHNLARNSTNAASGAGWSQVNATLTAGQADAYGGTGATRIQVGAGSAYNGAYQTTVASAGNQTVTVIARVRAGSGSTSPFRLFASHAAVADYWSPDLTATATYQWFAFTQTLAAGAGNVVGAVVTTGGAGMDIVLSDMAILYGSWPAASFAYVPTTTAAVYAPAISWNAATNRYLVQHEPARTNAIRNSAMVGAVSGSPGTLPTAGWGTFGGLTQTITAGVTLFGFPAFDIRFQGTFTGQQGLQFDIQRAAAASGQTWTGSVFVALVAGAMTNVSSSLVTSEHDAGGAFLDGNSTLFTATGAGARVVGSRTLNNASTASTQAYFAFNCTGAVDFTVRVACPQLEQGATATSPILTYGSTATRATDNPIVTGLPTSSAYTLVADIVPFDVSSGFQVDIRLSDGTTSNSVLTYLAAAVPFAESFVGGVSQGVAAPGGSVAANALYRAAVASEAGRLAVSINGGSVATRASGTPPAGINRVELAGGGGGRNFGLARIRVLAGSAAANATLQALAA